MSLANWGKEAEEITQKVNALLSERPRRLVPPLPYTIAHAGLGSAVLQWVAEYTGFEPEDENNVTYARKFQKTLEEQGVHLLEMDRTLDLFFSQRIALTEICQQIITERKASGYTNIDHDF